MWTSHSVVAAILLSSLFLSAGLAKSTTSSHQFRSTCGTPPLEQCSFTDRFNYFDWERWEVSDNRANEQRIFNTWWSKDRVYRKSWNALDFSISDTPRFDKMYAGAEVKTRRWYGYGCYTVRMQPISVPGVISAFFLYTGPGESAPYRPNKHNEIDIEFVYRHDVGRVVMQSNYYTNTQGGNEDFHPLNFQPHWDFHLYSVKFTSTMIQWYVDGNLLRTATKNIPKLYNGPFKIFMNMWVVGPEGEDWAGKYYHRRDGPHTFFDIVQYTKGENCQVPKYF